MTTLQDYSYYALRAFRNAHPRASKIGNNTYLTEYEDRFVVRLHNTDILAVYPDSVFVNTGGWNTVTTLNRINRAMPPGCRAYQKDWQWYVDTPYTTQEVGSDWIMRRLIDGSWNVVVP